MTRFIARPLSVAVSALMAAVLLLFTAVPSYAADPVAPPVSDVDWDRYSKELKGRGSAARMPVKAGATRTGSSFNTAAAMKRARATYAQKHVTTSKPATPATSSSPATKGKVTASQTPKAGPGAKKVGLKMAKGAGGAVAGIIGFNLAYEFTSSVVGGLFGMESNGFICDISQAFSDSDCSVSADPGYVPNSDAIGKPMGWANTNVLGLTYNGSSSAYPKTATFTVDIVGPEPVFNSATGTYSVTVTLGDYQCVGNGLGVSINGVAIGRNPSTGATSQWGGGQKSGTVQATCNSSNSATMTWTGNSSVAFDHLEFFVSSTAYTANPVRVFWYPQGHSLWTPGANGDPRRHWLTSWQCEIGGGVIMHGSAESEPFFESDPEWPGFPEATCDNGTLVEWHVDQLSDGLDPLRIFEWTLPDDVAEWAAEYPECTDASCTLELQRLDKTTGKAMACFDAPDLCADWFADPQKTENYQCVYGTKVIALDECNLYAPTFSQKLGGGIGDPVTGEKTDTTTTGPGTAPTDPLITQPGTSLWGSNNRPGNCPPPFSWSSLINPWWYYQGVKCALVEAFIPAEPAAPFLAASEAWQKTHIATMFASWSGIFDGLRVTPSCEGPVLRFPADSYLAGSYSLFTACRGWGAEWAPRIHSASTWIVGVFFSFAMINTITRGFGYDLNAPNEGTKKS